MIRSRRELLDCSGLESWLTVCCTAGGRGLLVGARSAWARELTWKSWNWRLNFGWLCNRAGTSRSIYQTSLLRRTLRVCSRVRSALFVPIFDRLEVAVLRGSKWYRGFDNCSSNYDAELARLPEG